MISNRPVALATRLLSLVSLIFTVGCPKASSPTASNAATPGTVVAVPARAGAVDGKSENSDAFIWELFTQFTAPVNKGSASPAVFETWASDDDTFSDNPHWPQAGEPLELQPSFLSEVKTLDPDSLANAHAEIQALAKIHAKMQIRSKSLAKSIDVPCKRAPGGAAGGFPTVDPYCVAEQVGRNYPLWNYIVSNKLNTPEGLKAAYQKGTTVEMPTDSIAIKADWVPLETLVKWVPQLGDIANARKLYYTAVVGKTEFAVVSMHVASRQNPNWVWGTFEHQMNPGRCDYIGCYDTFGAQTAEVQPQKSDLNSQYGACAKTSQLKALMAKANVPSVWENYCLKSTQVDYVAADGTPYVLGNSVIEGVAGNGTVAASSCITCHRYASFGADGVPTESALKILPFNPTGKPIPGVLAGSRTFAFMWGVAEASKKK